MAIGQACAAAIRFCRVCGAAKPGTLRLSQSRIKYECVFRAAGAKDFPLIIEPWIGIQTPIRFGGDSNLLCLWAAQRLKCCAYSLMIFAFFTSHIFPCRAQPSPRGGNAAHRAAYWPTPARPCKTKLRIRGRNRIPEKYHRVFAADFPFLQ